MKLRWYIEYSGDKRLQYKTDLDYGDDYWINVDTVFERELTWRENDKLKARIKELEAEYEILSKLLDKMTYGKS